MYFNPNLAIYYYSFTAQNHLTIISSSTVREKSTYKYDRSIIRLGLNDEQTDLPRRLYIASQKVGDPDPPITLNADLVLYCIRGDFSDVDQTINDYEKACVVTSNERFTMHMPIDLNGQKIYGQTHYLHGVVNTGSSENIFNVNGSESVLLYYGSVSKKIISICSVQSIVYPALNVEIQHGLDYANINGYIAGSPTREQVIILNLNLPLPFFRMFLKNKNIAKTQDIYMVLEYVVN